ncbi:MAG: LPXTG cell wall anchor domain-containing protein [bacterium]|nr:LPXTG cell wall anchor domain-containing protein [bacterium]
MELGPKFTGVSTEAVNTMEARTGHPRLRALLIAGASLIAVPTGVHATDGDPVDQPESGTTTTAAETTTTAAETTTTAAETTTTAAETTTTAAATTAIEAATATTTLPPITGYSATLSADCSDGLEGNADVRVSVTKDEGAPDVEMFTTYVLNEEITDGGLRLYVEDDGSLLDDGSEFFDVQAEPSSEYFASVVVGRDSDGDGTIEENEKLSLLSQSFSLAACEVETTTTTSVPTTDGKVDICHATHSETNPYTQNNVNDDAIDGNGNGSADHNRDDHQDGEDIIPPFYDDGTPGYWPARNWDAEGQEIFNEDCEVPEEATTTSSSTSTTIPGVTTTTEATTTTTAAATTTTAPAPTTAETTTTAPNQQPTTTVKPPPTPPAEQPPTGDLPATGSETGEIALIAGFTLAAGIAAVAGSRRRRTA